jgi:hypothetical protein
MLLQKEDNKAYFQVTITKDEVQQFAIDNTVDLNQAISLLDKVVFKINNDTQKVENDPLSFLKDDLIPKLSSDNPFAALPILYFIQIYQKYCESEILNIEALADDIKECKIDVAPSKNKDGSDYIKSSDSYVDSIRKYFKNYSNEIPKLFATYHN